MNLKEKNLVGAKDESSVVEMTQQEFLELLRKNGYLNQEIPINQVVAQQPSNAQNKKGGRDLKKFVLKQLGNAQLIELNDQDPNRMQYQTSNCHNFIAPSGYRHTFAATSSMCAHMNVRVQACICACVCCACMLLPSHASAASANDIRESTTSTINIC